MIWFRCETDAVVKDLNRGHVYLCLHADECRSLSAQNECECKIPLRYHLFHWVVSPGTEYATLFKFSVSGPAFKSWMETTLGIQLCHHHQPIFASPPPTARDSFQINNSNAPIFKFNYLAPTVHHVKNLIIKQYLLLFFAAAAAPAATVRGSARVRRACLRSAAR